MSRVEEFEFIPGAPEAVARLNQGGARVIVVTNQSGIARGYFGHDAVAAVHNHLQDELKRCEAHVDAFYYCPNHPEGTVDEYAKPSRDRKPGPGMFERAIRDFELDGDRRFVVGDNLHDLVAGDAVGCVTILVRTGHGAEYLQRADEEGVRIDYVARDLPDAVEWILSPDAHH